MNPFFPAISVTPGQNYTLPVWYKWGQYGGNDWGYDRIYVQNADGTQAALQQNLHTLCTQSTWCKFTLSFTPSGSTVLISIGQFGPKFTTTATPNLTTTATPALEVYFDNVQLSASTNTPTPPVTPSYTPISTYTPTATYTPTPSLTPAQTYTPTATLAASPTSTPSPLQQAKYTYDGDGNLVKSDVTTQDGTDTITYYVSGYYNVQVTGSTTKVQKFYTFGSQIVAIQTSLNGAQSTLNWVMTDNLNSTTVTAKADGTFNSELRYSAFGEIRFSSGVVPTNYQYTGQLSQQAIGLDYYVARWYVPFLHTSPRRIQRYQIRVNHKPSTDTCM
ncbi:MAG: hypothetical protein P4L50_21460 [Anaerolineaceae bacterium]|nr:hypothetical protein [Anaerolineaceae bacterium]